MTMNKREFFIALLKEMKNTNITYKRLAERLHINVNSLYTWIQKGNISEKKATYLLGQIKNHFFDEYIYCQMMIEIRKDENEILGDLQAGDAVL